jgi:hypothetical protein
MPAFLNALPALALLAPVASAGDPAQHPPTMPNSSKGANKCTGASRYGASFKVFITKGKSRISCSKARKTWPTRRRSASSTTSTGTTTRSCSG